MHKIYNMSENVLQRQNCLYYATESHSVHRQTMLQCVQNCLLNMQQKVVIGLHLSRRLNEQRTYNV